MLEAGSDWPGHRRIPLTLVPLDRRSRGDARALPPARTAVPRSRRRGRQRPRSSSSWRWRSSARATGRSAEQALEDACDTLAQFELRGPFTASFADRSVIDAHRGRIERARRTLLGILDGVEGSTCSGGWCATRRRAPSSSAPASYEAADRAWTTMREEARAVGWIDFLDDRSEPDHVEALLALGRLDERARRARAPGVARANAATVVDRCRAPAGPCAGPRGRRRPGGSPGDRRRGAHRSCGCRSRRPACSSSEARSNVAPIGSWRRETSLTEALGVFEELGSPPWAQRARDEIARLGLRHRSPDRADRERTPDRRAGRHRHDESAGGGSGVRQPEDRRGEPRPRLPEARASVHVPSSARECRPASGDAETQT